MILTNIIIKQIMIILLIMIMITSTLTVDEPYM